MVVTEGARKDPAMQEQKSKKTVIVVDDSRSAREQVMLALADENLHIVEAVDGRDGLAKLELHRDASLVICDINMPEMNGLDMLGALFDSGRLGALPVIMLTTESQPELLRKAKERGAKGWIVKPFKPGLLVAAVRKLVAA
jgi:two-component system chemotaxis response regulator CheY